jgi:two-component system sensor kinase FixL
VGRQRSALSSKARIAVGAICVALATSLAGIIWQVVDSTRARREIVVSGNRASAQIASGLVSAELKGHVRVIEGFSHRPSVVTLFSDGNWQGLNTHLLDLRGIDPELSTVAAVDSKGLLRALQPEQPELLGQDFSTRDYFRGAMSSNEGYVSEVFRQKAKPYKMVIAFASAVREPGGRALGLFVAAYPTNAFEVLTQTVRVPNRGSVRVFDRFGHPVIDAVEDPPPSHASHPLVSKALNGFSGIEEGELPMLSGTRLVAFEPVRGFGWSVLVEQPKSVAFQPVGDYAGLAGVAGIVMFMALVSAGMLVRLVRKLDSERGRSSAILGSAMDAVVSMNDEGVITEFNPAAERMFAFNREEVIGKPLAETIVPPELADEHRKGLARYLETGENKVIGRLTQLEAMRSDRTIFPVELSISLIDLPGPPSFIGVIRDITERKRSEDTLRESESYKSALLESVAEAVVTTDSEGRVASINPAMEEFAGWSQSEVVGRPYIDTYPLFDSSGELLSTDRRLLEKAIKTRQPVVSHGFDLMLLSRDGRRIPVAITSSPILDRNGQFLGGVEVIRDVTHEKEVDQMKSALISTVSHELRTPLTMIQGFAELLLTPKFERRHSREALEQIHVASHRLGRLIDDLLSVSRIESGRFVVRSEPVRVDPVVEEVLTTSPANREVISYVDENLPAVRADRDMLVQILTNLVSNAAKYSAEPTPITVSAKGNGSSVEVSVADEGIGMTDAEVASLFEKFYRADRPEVHEAGGTGLGLYITKSLVEMQGGQIWVKSDPGRGSIFSFSLPIADGDANGSGP